MILTKPHQVKEEKKMQENFLYKINTCSTKKECVYISDVVAYTEPKLVLEACTPETRKRYKYVAASINS
ncbi:hypothetical protein NC652_020714 [Populus alba x Populus x berolinensis]|nr:hypothetical protein NC652_020714 [Populus alba x Populus x berolinensis]